MSVLQVNLIPDQPAQFSLSFPLVSMIINNQSNGYLYYNGQVIAAPSQQLTWLSPAPDSNPQLVLTAVPPAYLNQVTPTPMGMCHIIMYDLPLLPNAGIVQNPKIVYV